MFTYQQKKKAIELYIKNGKRMTKTLKQLGYPSKGTLTSWYKEYENNSSITKKYKRDGVYTKEEIDAAISHFYENGESITKTIVSLGYPCSFTLRKWLKGNVTNYKPKEKASSVKDISYEQKVEAVTDMCTSDQTVDEIALKYNVTRSCIYGWKSSILSKGDQHTMAKKKESSIIVLNSEEELKEEIIKLKKQAQDLQDEVYKLQLEKDILSKAAEIIKKDNGINIDLLTNKEKVIVIDALRSKYKLKSLLTSLKISKSSYGYNHKVLISDDKYSNLRIKIKELFIQNVRTYGYRRINHLLRKENIIVSDKVVIRLMKEEGLVVYRPKMKKYSSYEGEITPAVENLLERNFKSDEPFNKLLTDITEFHIPAGKVYLSPAIDCFDGLPLAWTIGTSPNADLANTMLDKVIAIVPKGKHPIIHSDRGCHYRWPGWIERMRKAEFIRSMSKKGCSPDNSACEGFFGRLKNEFFYCRDWMNVSIDEFIKELDEYIQWYGKTRIKMSLGGLSPIDYRTSLNFIVNNGVSIYEQYR